jgi:ribonuclease R
LESLPKSPGRAISADRLAAALDLGEDQESRLREYLSAFVQSGLARAKGGRYWRSGSSGLLIGTLRGTRSGHAFVVPDDERERAMGDLHVAERSTGSAMHGDKVIARVTRIGKRGRSGAVEAVLQRESATVVGRFVRLRTESFVSPLEEKFMYDVAVSPSDSLGAATGDIVNVEITRPPIAGRPPRGRVLEVLGREDDPGIDLEIIIRKHRLPHIFPEAAIAEAAAVDEAVSASAARADFREQMTVTIDGETARDFDDAVSLQLLPNGRYRLGVHIADVSHYVREGTALDEEAYRRGTSVYFPERAIPMLPERLSNLICSLNPRADRLTMSAVLELDRSGKVVDYTLTPSIIRSRERMTYTNVNRILTDPEGDTAKEYAHVAEMLVAMHELALILIGRREQRGAIDFELPEAELQFNDEGQIAGIVRSERNIAHRLIEEFMLLANETVAKHLEKLGAPALYRIHEEPDPGKVKEFKGIAESFGHKFSMHGPVPQRGFQHLLREAAGRPEERMLSFLMLRSMERARYSPQNKGHFGLAMKTYTHFTSPIRRYPDLVVHRILRRVIERGNAVGLDLAFGHALKQIKAPVFEDEEDQELRRALEGTAIHSSERERAADDAERELMDWRKADFMATRLGDQFEGVLTSVKEYGFYVELAEVFVEGLVHISTLKDDLYEYQPRRHRLVGVRTGGEYRLGDTITVTVDRVDRARHLIDFSPS